MKYVYSLDEDAPTATHWSGCWMLAFLSTSPRDLARAARELVEEGFEPGNFLRMRISQAPTQDGFEINHAYINVHPDTELSKNKLKNALSAKNISAALDENSTILIV